MKPKFKRGDFALVQGQIVEILDIRMHYNDMTNYFTYKVRLRDSTLSNWLYESEINEIVNQTTPQVLYGKVK